MNDAFPGAVCSVVALMCESLLGESVEVSIDGPAPPERALWVRVDLLGECSGEVWVGPSRALVTRVSTRVFPRNSQLTESDLEDTARELGNIVAGNLKVLFPDATRTGLPQTQSAEPAASAGRDDGVHLSIDGDAFSVFVRWPSAD
jgi:hypothetical protein